MAGSTGTGLGCCDGGPSSLGTSVCDTWASAYRMLPPTTGQSKPFKADELRKKKHMGYLTTEQVRSASSLLLPPPPLLLLPLLVTHVHAGHGMLR